MLIMSAQLTGSGMLPTYKTVGGGGYSFVACLNTHLTIDYASRSRRSEYDRGERVRYFVIFPSYYIMRSLYL